MANAEAKDLELLRRRLSVFIHRPSPWHVALHELQQRIRTQNWSVFVFGGTLRDILALSTSIPPRDLDLVVAGATPQELQKVFSPELVRINRFGGLHLHVRKLPVDIWTLDSTWAFRERLIPGSDFSDLPKTTFLDVEAVVAKFQAQPGRARQVFSQNFFRAIVERQVEINLEENPFPALCVVRSLVTARRLQFSLGPRLVRFILHHTYHLALEELEAVQQSHYGRILLDRNNLHSLLKLLRDQVGGMRVRPVLLPRWHQLNWHAQWGEALESGDKREGDGRPITRDYPSIHTSTRRLRSRVNRSVLGATGNSDPKPRISAG